MNTAAPAEPAASAVPTDAMNPSAMPAAVDEANPSVTEASTAPTEPVTPADTASPAAPVDTATPAAPAAKTAVVAPVVQQPVAKVEDLVGKKVAFVEVAGASQTNPDAILAVTRLKPGDVWAADKVRQDLKLIYEMGTFADATADFFLIPEGVKVVYNVKENPILKGFLIQGNNKVSQEKILSFMTVKPGKVLNSKTVADNLRAVEEYYKGLGYILVKTGDVDLGQDGILKVRIYEGIVEDIVVKGNVKTKAYVVTREMKLEKGQPFNAKDARRSMQKLYNLGFFEDVNVKLVPGKMPGQTIVEVVVAEQKTGTFSIGGGYSDSNGLVGIITVGDKNFRGTGDNVNVHWEFGGSTGATGNYSVSYQRPWLDRKQTSLSFTVFNMLTQYSDYDTGGNNISTYNKKYRGFDVTLGRPVNEKATNLVTFKNRWDEYIEWVSGVNYTTDPNYAPYYIPNNFGLTRSIMLTRVFDTRDSTTNPSEGTRYALSGEFAGLGGDFAFTKYTYEIRHYWKIGKSQVFATRGTLGYGTGSIPSTQQFSAGGIETLRGYQDNEFRGNRMILASAEYRFPVAKRVQAAFFTDIGNAWYDGGDAWKYTGINQNSGLLAGYGAGILFTSPFGPIRIDYAMGSQGGRTHFGFGGKF